ncbi:MAG: hypothetical protein BWZ02_00668 [Lentisphaerae bacterium ADurb.BinA184]|nr:MAG: hypothetical protein BWZ02_00668 [Lentisphaerae bacterium ADurb.BinA184]
MIGSYGADHNAITPRSRHVFWWHWNEYAGGFRPYPGVAAPGETPPAAAADGKHALTGSKRYEDWIGAFADSRNQTPPVYHTPFVNYGTPGGFPAYNEEAMATPYSWKLHNNRAVRSYMTYWLDRCAREIGIAGVYVDEPYVQGWSYNVLAGDAPYVRADGTRAIGYQYLDGRAYFRRFKQMFTENGSDYSVWAHTTSQKVYPQLAFADISMDGEHPSIWVPEFSNYHSFYNPRYSRGCLAGHNTGMVGAQMYHANTDARPGRDPDALVKVHWKNRTFLAVTLPYGVLPMPATCAAEYNRAQNLAARIGVLDAGIEEVSAHELPARVPGVSFTPALQGMHALVNRAAAQALLFASAPRPAAYDHAEAPRLHLAGDWGGLLAATGKAVHLWNAENGVSLATADGLELDLPPLDFAALWIEARPAPQPPRPPGVILGLSFDAGVEPGFGAGLTPPRAAAPDLVEGRKGRALKLRSSQTGVAYPLVPAWNGGALECDLRLDRLTRTPLPLLRLSEHLDLTLTASLRDGRPALVLTTRDAPVTEQPMSGVWVFDGKADAGEPHETVAPLPADATGAWHRLALVWRCGWYQLYWDGQRLAESRVPASPRIQSAAVGAMGVAIGPDEPVGGGDEAEAAVDSVLLYDWPLGEANLAEGDRNPFVPVRRPPPQAHGRVWADAPDRDNVRVAAWFAGASRPWDVERVRFTVRAGGPTGRELGRADVMPWQARGYASRWIRFHLKELPDTGLPDLADTEPEETDADNETWHVRADFLRLVREGKETRDEVLFNAETEVALDVFDLPEAK